MSAPTPPILAYLAEPIDQHARVVPGVAEIRSALQYAGFNTYRPRRAFECYGTLDPRIDQINRDALYRADIVIAALPAGHASIGVPTEIEAATARGIPALVYHDGSSYALAANPLVTVVDTTIGIGVRALEIVGDRRSNHHADHLRVILADGWDPPARGYADDAGIDLVCTQSVQVPAGVFVDLSTQVVAMQLPRGQWGMVTGRSSTIRQRGLHVPTGVIDPGWRGALYVGAWNLTHCAVDVAAGDRLGQLVMIPASTAAITVVKQVDPHPRGGNGFGSTGA